MYILLFERINDDNDDDIDYGVRYIIWRSTVTAVDMAVLTTNRHG